MHEKENIILTVVEDVLFNPGMPIHGELVGGCVHSILEGHLTDEDLLSYYQLPMFGILQPPWIEIVDGRLVTQMEVTVNGQRRLGMMAESRGDALRGGRVAMVAADDLCFGMFRMWEMIRPDLDYELRVFRDFDEAKKWIEHGTGCDLSSVGGSSMSASPNP